MISLKKRIFFLVFLLGLGIPQPVSAYLDPGFASMVWQMIAAMLFGAAFAIKIYWQKIKFFFSRNKPTPPQE